MSWICLKDRLPPKEGWYQAVKLHPGIKELAFFKAVPPWKSVNYLNWTTKMKLESDSTDRCVYLKYKCFVNQHGLEQNYDEIIYWYELDPIPEEK
jgi:hypothetical protein